MVDARKRLETLQEEWESCSRCDLGKRRLSEKDARFVFGEGTRRSLMLIGEGPGEVEEAHGRPFVGPSGKLLRRVMHALGVDDYYLTNIVACRSCSPQLDSEGNPIIIQQKRGPPRMPMRDEPPIPAQYAACRPRLEEEIYLVDPIVIVGLGGTAAKALTQKEVTITRERGDASHIYITGASHRPVRTEKRKEWVRIRQGKVEAPTEPNEVAYFFIPTLHPAYVLRKIADRGADSPFRQFVNDLKVAVQVYEEYEKLVFGVHGNSVSEVTAEDVLDQYDAAVAAEEQE